MRHECLSTRLRHELCFLKLRYSNEDQANVRGEEIVSCEQRAVTVQSRMASITTTGEKALTTENTSKYVGTLRAGFHLVAKLGNNSTPLRNVVFNTSKGVFTSTDEKGMRGWRVINEGAEPSCEDFIFIPNAPKTTCFYSAVTFVDELAIYFVATLDGSLRVYDDRLNELSFFKWDQGAVLKMLYNPILDELITAGKHGIMFWKCLYDSKAANAWMSDHSEHDNKSSAKVSASVFEGRKVPWRGGEFSELILRHKIHHTIFCKPSPSPLSNSLSSLRLSSTASSIKGVSNQEIDNNGNVIDSLLVRRMNNVKDQQRR